MNIDDFKELNVGDTVYKITDVGILPFKIKGKDESGYYKRIILENARIEMGPKSYNKTWFRKKEDAEKALEDKEKNKIKKKKLYEYELKLNKELGLETFLIKY